MNRTLSPIVALFAITAACASARPIAPVPALTTALVAPTVLVEASTATEFVGQAALNAQNLLVADAGAAAGYLIDIPESGRYQVTFSGAAHGPTGAEIWLEDYVENTDGRSYNVTGPVVLAKGLSGDIARDGSPFAQGRHRMKFHVEKGAYDLARITFQLVQPHQPSPVVHTQATQGANWKLVWSDEFNGTGRPDSTKWSYDVGNWGWGNKELEYYTADRPENARLEGGNLIIEARKNDGGHPWTSARLTTRGKESFLYGRIEFRAKVPAADGTWAAGWTLGDAYVDELSWPYCGEIDVLESVGFEIDDQTGNGKTHVSVHSRAHYFRLGNQPTATIELQKMDSEFHVYAIEWLPSGIKSFVDGVEYLNYHDTSSKFAWPFDVPQNLVLNLAMGGEWGGAHGVNEEVLSNKFVVDYVRVYARE